MTDHLPPLSDDEFVSLHKVGKSDRQSEIPQLHGSSTRRSLQRNDSGCVAHTELGPKGG